MKKTFLLLTLLLLTVQNQIFSQNIEGDWNGALNISGVQLRLIFHIEQTENGLKGTMDSPDQGAKGLTLNAVSFENSILKLSMKQIGMEYQGTLSGDSIIGKFSQMGAQLPLNLYRKAIEKITLIRPQEPKEPFDYYVEEVTLENAKDGITLAGTLTLPAKTEKTPVVVLISGSGAQNRDEELFGHKPFLVIADYLTRNGIGVLRFDDRGVGASKGNYNSATSADLANDVEAAVSYLMTKSQIDKKNIGLIGHSEGGLIAPMVAQRNKNVAFIILLAGPGLRGDKLLELQTLAVTKANGASDELVKRMLKFNKGTYDLVLNSNDTEKLKIDLENYLQKAFKENPDFTPGFSTEQLNSYIKASVAQMTTPWMKYYIKYDPYPTLTKLKIPVLALNGAKDTQVAPKENLEAIRKAFDESGNKKLTAIELPNLNHLFQESTTGSPNEYPKIEQTFSPTALEQMNSWIHKHLK
ncbi:MAG: alpha/beta fold hydrolase [Dysgonamonadaceae bacterium]